MSSGKTELTGRANPAIYSQRCSGREAALPQFPELTTIFHRSEHEIWEIKRTRGEVYEMAKRGTPKPKATREEDLEGHRLHEQSVAAAKEWARLLLNPEVVGQLKVLISSCTPRPVVVPILSAIPPSDANATTPPTLNFIPLGYAAVLAEILGLEVQTPIIQKTKVGRTGASALDRVIKQAEFKLTNGTSAIIGQNILLVDDHVTQGGTALNALSFLWRCGGNVVAVSTLAASRAPYELFVPQELFNNCLKRGHPARISQFAALYTILSGREFDPMATNSAKALRLTASEFSYFADRGRIDLFAEDLLRALKGEVVADKAPEVALGADTGRRVTVASAALEETSRELGKGGGEAIQKSWRRRLSAGGAEFGKITAGGCELQAATGRPENLKKASFAAKVRPLVEGPPVENTPY